MNIKTLMPIPLRLSRIPSPPKEIFYRGESLDLLLEKPRLAIVGSRKVTKYGQAVTSHLARQLAGQGIVIVSGLAYGVDALAHRAALEAGGLTIAVLPGPLDDIAPRIHRKLADEILANGGALISEYPSGIPILKQNFIARNRLVAGLADAVLITEAAEKSGSLHTARFALEQGKDVLAVPGNINSPMSVGTNNLIKSGATPITSSREVLYALNLDEEALAGQKPRTSRNPAEQGIIELIQGSVTDGEELQEGSNLPVNTFNQTLTMLEITGVIRPLGNNHWTLN